MRKYQSILYKSLFKGTILVSAMVASFPLNYFHTLILSYYNTIIKLWQYMTIKHTYNLLVQTSISHSVVSCGITSIKNNSAVVFTLSIGQCITLSVQILNYCDTCQTYCTSNEMGSEWTRQCNTQNLYKYSRRQPHKRFRQRSTFQPLSGKWLNTWKDVSKGKMQVIRTDKIIRDP